MNDPVRQAIEARRNALLATAKRNRQAAAEGRVHPTDKQGVPIPPPEPEGGDE